MKVRVKVDIENIHVDQVVEGESEVEVAQKMRDELARRAGLARGMAIRALPDQVLWGKVVEGHNRRFGAREPAPRTAGEFLAFAERAGYLTRLD